MWAPSNTSTVSWWPNGTRAGRCCWNRGKDEVLSLSDRILVMYEGEIVGELDPASTDAQELGLYMSGAKRAEKEGWGA